MSSNCRFLLFFVIVSGFLAGCAGPEQRPKQPSAQPVEQESNIATRIYSGHIVRFEGERERRILRNERKEKILSAIHKGSAFVLERDTGLYLVTAAHVVHPPRLNQGAEVPIGRRNWEVVEVKNVQSQVRAGGLSVQLSSPIVDDPGKDIVVYRLSPSDFEHLDVEAHRPGGRVVAGESVRVWGFPKDTPDTYIREALVSSRRPVFFTINRPLEAGFSGGPVLSEPGNRLVGIALRSMEQQARCLCISELISLIGEAEK